MRIYLKNMTEIINILFLKGDESLEITANILAL
jgi:hypothetical protein